MDEQLRQIETLIQSGQKNQAYTVLKNVIKSYPSDPDAWRLMIQVAPTPEIRARCEQHLQQIAPNPTGPSPKLPEKSLTSDAENWDQPSETVSHKSPRKVKKIIHKHTHTYSTGPSSLAVGASIAVLVGALWVLVYLQMTAITLSMTYSGTIDKGTLWEYVVGSRHNLEEMASEALFVGVMRFILGFGLSWLPITALLSLIQSVSSWIKSAFSGTDS